MKANLPTRYFCGIAFLLTIATLLRLYKLNSQLWLDEISALIGSIRRPLLNIVTQWPESSSHVFFEFLASISRSLLGESPFAIRLPAALFGIAGIAALYMLATQLFSQRHALFIASLMAVSYHHVFISQNARGYSALIFFYLVASYFFLQFYQTKSISIRNGSIYIITIVLVTYSVPFGSFIPAAHFLLAFFSYLLNRNQVRTFPPFPISRFVCLIFVAGTITTLLYLPFITNMLSHAQMNLNSKAEGPRLGVWLFIELIQGLSNAFFGVSGLIIAFIIGVIGLIVWYKSNAISVFVLALPLILQASVFIFLGFGIHPRYFAIALPCVFLAGGHTLAVFTQQIIKYFAISEIKQEFCVALCLTAIIFVSALPLNRYYKFPKQDFEGAIKYVEKLAAIDHIKVGVLYAGTALTYYHNADFIKVDSQNKLLELESKTNQIWLVTTLEQIGSVAEPELLQYIKHNYKLVETLPGTIGDGDIRIYTKKNTNQPSASY